MKYKDGKPLVHPDKRSRVLLTAIVFLVVCGFSFYLGGIYCSQKDNVDENVDVSRAVESLQDSSIAPLKLKAVVFSECNADYQDYTPCTDPRVSNCFSLQLTFNTFFFIES